MKKKILIAVITVIIVIVICIIIFPNYFKGATENLSARTGNTANGQKSINFTLKDLSGNDISLEDFKGKKVFLNFWATWCVPCTQEMPYINEIYKEYKDIEIVTINLSEPTNSVEKFMKDNNYEFRVLLDSDGEVGDKYRAYSIPTSILINEEGDVVDKRIGSMQKEQLISFMGLD